MRGGRSNLVALIAALALVWHVCAVLTPAWIGAVRPHGGRDFASYYWAAQVALDGGDPYDRRALGEAAKAEGVRASVHPFFYPPPFVAGTAWVAQLDPHTAFLGWFWLDELAALAAAVALWRWWRPLDPLVPAAVAGLFALLTALPNNHVMGQANLPVLALVIGGLWAERAGRAGLGGVLLGVACMAKMSPALFVAWWLLRGRWRAVGWACATAVVLSVLALPIVGFQAQVGFYLRVLPQFASGDYNGLGVPIQLFGNHSLPNVLDWLFPSGGGRLSGASRALGAILSVAGISALGLLFRARDADGWAVAGQVSAVSVGMLLIPVYTYEHHLVWALPAGVCCVAAASAGRLPGALAVLAGLGLGALAFDLQALKELHEWLGPTTGPGMFVRELKFLALVTLLAVTSWLGATGGTREISHNV